LKSFFIEQPHDTRNDVVLADVMLVEIEI